MMRQGHVGVYSMTALVIMSGLIRLFLSLPQTMARAGQGAGWMIPLLSALILAPIFYVYYRLVLLYPGKNGSEIVDEVYGRWLGLPVNFILWLTMMAIGSLTLRQFAETFITVALPHTPISILIITALAVTCYGSYLGLETITRTGLLIVPWILGALAFIYLGVVPYVDVHYLFPLWGSGIPRVALSGAFRIGQFLELFTLAQFATNLRRQKDFAIIGFVSLGTIAILFSLGTAIHEMASSSVLAQQIPYPLYFLARVIYFGRFYQRLEATFIIIWFFAAIMGTLLSFHTAITIVVYSLRLPFHYPLVYPTAIIMFTMALLPRSFAEAQRADALGLREDGSILWLLVLLTYFIALLRKRRSKSDDKENP